ncbi:5-methyltetrahydropteroyltriglutamate--homocysteine S-methyltransferase [Undibacterium macrobrachii]|uniref:5-methyltetrahydropteroyltriglutamate--homocysteine methyltransferase n=1 Tax=Undibacterium macrobrachii TaxID=1119058 RepID=A0ABQ2XM32_9BURK|nr:5-methyltetrahydropteroyltriglutamate--homocysteine S-methyltransferase [Undibacterium macrobrachii]GGX22358.1 5-methyltetrahydropteroyltriglutamate--homocysteine methyltransferase [Undibacterium macrobrachii]
MSIAHILGFPRIGAQRELKFAQEAFWRGEINEATLRDVGSDLRARHWALQQEAGLDFVTVGDFAWYDQVLSTLSLFGALPIRYGFDGQHTSLENYFTAARGNAQHVAMEMTKWFDTNYHYLVPEWTADTEFQLQKNNALLEEVRQAQQLGHRVKVSLLGPLSLLYLGKVKSGLNSSLDLLHKILPAYQNLLSALQEIGVEWVQIDEPILVVDLSPEWLRAFQPSYQLLSAKAPKLLLTTYFDAVAEHADLLHRLPVDGVHIDVVRAPQQLDALLKDWPQGRVLSLGVIDGRNIWRADLSTLLQRYLPVHAQLQAKRAPLWLAASCSLLHVPVDLDVENKLDPELRSWLAFAVQKLTEIVSLKHALDGRLETVQAQFTLADAALQSRRVSKRIHIDAVQKRLTQVQHSDAERKSPFAQRIIAQQQRFDLPLFPTTTIGSFPQTTTIRQARAAYKRGGLKHLEYLEAMRAEIAHVVAAQEKIGLDVLVHGEAERNDMVEYFGEQLWGYGFTQFGWVQSYGSRCVKPPFIYGDVCRPEAMTVTWSAYAQSLTQKPMKGMLTGPITMLQWSFVRDDQPRSTTALQIALALRDEVADLEKAGIGMIQIDEPAFREGLPLKQKDWTAYLENAVYAFKLCSAVVSDETQIHTHMCYAEFNDILPWIAAMDADVISIETSRSAMELLEGFSDFAYPNHIGPGVYDIHSPRVAKMSEMQTLLQKARQLLPDQSIWVNPDCGLKTRAWPEALAALEHMVQAAKLLRASCEELEEDPHQNCC